MKSVAATLIQSTGSVYAERQGVRHALAPGDPIFAADVVITDATATADLRFTDGATARLSPETRLDVREYVFGDAEPSFMLHLAQGAMRSVSGEVVKQNPDAFKITSPQATVGIRGTELFNAVMGGNEVHAVVFVDKGHVVVVTAADGRSVTLDSPLQSVRMALGDLGPLSVEKFSLMEMEDFIRTMAPTLADKLTRPSNEAQDAAGQGDDAHTATAATLSVVVLAGMDSQSSAVAARLGDLLAGDGVDVRFFDLQAVDGTVNSAMLETMLQLTGQRFDAPSFVAGGGTHAPWPTPSPPIPPGPTPPDPPNPPDPPKPPDPPEPFVTHSFPGGIPTGSATGLQHLLNGADPAQANRFLVTGAVAGPLVGNALFMGGAAPFSLEEPTASGLQTAGDIFTVDSLTDGSADSIIGVDAGIYGDAVWFAVGQDQRLTFGDDTIHVGTMSGGALHGDAQMGEVGPQGDVNFGHDSISVVSMNSGAIYGDAYELWGSDWGGGNARSGASLFSGDNDSIHNGALYGDAPGGDVEPHCTVNFGHDSISITSLSGGSIYGDAEAVRVEGTVNFGHDSISITSLSGGSIYGDAKDVVVEGGNVVYGKDAISVVSMNSGAIYGDAHELWGTERGGDDVLRVDSLFLGVTVPGNVFGDAFELSGNAHGGNDSIHIGSMSSGRVYGDAWGMYDNAKGGSDTISIDHLSDGSVYGDGDYMTDAAQGGEDNIVIRTMSGGYVNGGGGADTITVSTMSGGTIVDASGEDSIRIGFMDSSNALLVEGGGAGHTLYLTQGGNIDLISGDGTTPNATSTIKNFGTLQLGDEGATLQVGTLADNATLLGGAGKDSLSIDNARYSEINGDAFSMSGDDQGNNDVIVIGSTLNASIQGDAHSLAENAKGGNDTIRVTTLEKSSISGDGLFLIDNAQGGDDSIQIVNLKGTGVVSGDTFDMKNTAKGGNDTIFFDSPDYPGSGTVYGDASYIYDRAQGGDDLIIANSLAGSVYGDAEYITNDGGGGADRFEIATMAGGSLSGDAMLLTDNATGGNDTFDIGTMNNGNIYGGAWSISGAATDGSDNITIGVMNRGSVYGGAQQIVIEDVSTCMGADVIHITTLNSGNVSGDVNIALSFGGTLTLGNDTITIDTVNESQPGAVNIYGDAETSAQASGGGLVLGSDNIHITAMTGGTLLGDTWEIRAVEGAEAACGNDIITISTLYDGAIYGDAAYATVDNGSLTLGNDTITIGTLYDGTLYGDAGNATVDNGSLTLGNDSIAIGTMHGGQIHGDGTNLASGTTGGNDTISITLLAETTAKLIDGNSGNDLFLYTNTTGHELRLDATGNVTIFQGATNITATTSTTITNFEGIGGGTGNDILDARAYAGGALLVGGGGNDALLGGAGNDTLVAQAAGGQSISLTGGDGADTFRLTCDGAGNVFTIEDFQKGMTDETITLAGAHGTPEKTLGGGILTLTFSEATLNIKGGWSGNDAQAAFTELVDSGQLQIIA